MWAGLSSKRRNEDAAEMDDRENNRFCGRCD